MFSYRYIVLIAACTFAPACGPPAMPDRDSTVVAAASNLTEAFEEIAQTFTSETGTGVTLSFGATNLLKQQIRNSAPFDIFAAADTETVASLASERLLDKDSCHIFARGRLALWSPERAPALLDLSRPDIRFIAIANPKTAPYGEASIQALKSAGLWDSVKQKIVYANSVSAARQFAETANADVAMTAYSLVKNGRGTAALVNEALHSPLDHALGILRSSTRKPAAARFVSYVLSPQGQRILAKFGYSPAARSN